MQNFETFAVGDRVTWRNDGNYRQSPKFGVVVKATAREVVVREDGYDTSFSIRRGKYVWKDELTKETEQLRNYREWLNREPRGKYVSSQRDPFGYYTDIPVSVQIVHPRAGLLTASQMRAAAAELIAYADWYDQKPGQSE